MKALKLKDGELDQCLYYNALFKKDKLFLVEGNYQDGFTIQDPISIHSIDEEEFQDEPGWSKLYSMHEDANENYIAEAGETSFGGQGFIALKNKGTAKYEWILHLGTMNNPETIRMDDNTVIVKTDLNYPNGVYFLIPIEKPDEFWVEYSTDVDLLK